MCIIEPLEYVFLRNDSLKAEKKPLQGEGLPTQQMRIGGALLLKQCKDNESTTDISISYSNK